MRWMSSYLRICAGVEQSGGAAEVLSAQRNDALQQLLDTMGADVAMERKINCSSTKKEDMYVQGERCRQEAARRVLFNDALSPAARNSEGGTPAIVNG